MRPGVCLYIQSHLCFLLYELCSSPLPPCSTELFIFLIEYIKLVLIQNMSSKSLIVHNLVFISFMLFCDSLEKYLR